mmetsp:Transcript_1230/g.1578  ORF Transcript_1230/g.1578 Transcript_1230/m.1578 type:complete len:152 (+) Transcript_1230:1093-1548(+)
MTPSAPNAPLRKKNTTPPPPPNPPQTTAPENTSASGSAASNATTPTARVVAHKLVPDTKKRSSSTTASKEPYEWVRCCNPSCGKWRAILRFMEASAVIESAKNGEWYCVQNTWDEKIASCAAPQENLPAIGCPHWVMQDVEDKDVATTGVC